MNPQTLLLITTPPASLAIPLLQGEPPLERLVNGLAGLVLLVLVVLCLVAFIAVLTVLLPKASESSKAALLRSPWRAFLIGLANYLFLGGISLILFSTNINFLGLIGLLIVSFLTGVTVIGLTGLVPLIGERLAMLHGQEMSDLKQLVWGTIALALAGLLPFVGWLLLMPVLQMVSFGAAVLAWRNRKQPEVVGETIEEGM